MTYAYDFSTEITAELDILSINLSRELSTIMPLNPTCADLIRLAMINDISSKVAFDIEELSAFLNKSVSYVSRRVRHLDKRGWLRHNKFTGAIRMGDLFLMADDPNIADLNFLVNQTKASLEEMQAQSGLNTIAMA